MKMDLDERARFWARRMDGWMDGWIGKWHGLALFSGIVNVYTIFNQKPLDDLDDGQLA
jgi:hypothetical protein